MIQQALTITVDGSPMQAYLARPDGDAPKAAVIVLQEIFGVNAEVKRITDLVASADYVGLAINYYHRTHPDLNEPYTQEGLQNGFAAAGSITRATLTADLTAAIDWLNEQTFVHHNHIATWGFCFGGTVAFFSGTLEGLAGAIAFYGGSIAAALPSGEPEMLADVAALKTPLLLVFGGRDSYIPPDAVARIQKSLADAHKPNQVQIYPDQDHAFFRDSSASMEGDDARSKAVADAWDLVQAFLRDHTR